MAFTSEIEAAARESLLRRGRVRRSLSKVGKKLEHLKVQHSKLEYFKLEPSKHFRTREETPEENPSPLAELEVPRSSDGGNFIKVTETKARSDPWGCCLANPPEQQEKPNYSRKNPITSSRLLPKAAGGRLRAELSTQGRCGAKDQGSSRGKATRD